MAAAEEERIKVDSTEVLEASRAFDRLSRSVLGTSESTEKLATEDDQLAGAANRATTQNRQLNTAITQQATSANTASTATNSLSSHMQTATRAANGLLLKFVTLEVGKRVLTATTRLLTSSVAAYAATDDRASEAMDRLRGSTRGVQVAIGDAIIGGENLDAIVGTLTRGFTALSTHIAENREEYRELARNGVATFLDVGAGLIRFFGGLNQLITLGEGGLRMYATALSGVAEIAKLNPTIAAVNYALGGQAFSLERVSGLWHEFWNEGEETVTQLDIQQQAIDKLADSVSGLASEVRNATVGFSGFRSVLDTVNSITDNLIAKSKVRVDGHERESSARRTEAEETRSWGDVVTDTLARISDAYDRMMEARNKASLARKSEIAQQIAQEQQLAAQLDAIAASVAGKGAAESLARKAAESEQAAQRFGRTKAILEDVANAAGSAVTSIGQAFGEALSGGNFAEFGKAVTKALADTLVSIGSAQIAYGVMNLVPPPWNPLGNPAIGAQQIAGGSAAVVVGSALGAASAPTGGGGGGGGGGNVPRPAQSSGSSGGGGSPTTIYSNTIQAGFITDSRATVRQLSAMERRARRNGIR